MQGFDVSSIRSGNDKTVWVPYNDEVSLEIKHIPRERFSQIVIAATRTIWDKSHQPEQIVDNIKMGELLGDEAIVNWTGFVDDGKEFPCTQENKKLLMRKWGNFAKFVSNVCTDLERLMDIEQDAERKNLETTSGPVPTTLG